MTARGGRARQSTLATRLAVGYSKAMNRKRIAVSVLILGLIAGPARLCAQNVLSDFSDLSGDGAVFLDSWLNGANPQFTQQADYVTIEPVAGGNPQSDGRFLVPAALDLDDYASLQITARENPGNQTGVIRVIFENTGGAVREFEFDSGDFAGGSLVTLSVAMSSYNYSDVGFNPAAVTSWGIEGDKEQTPLLDFRFDFGHLQLTPVPEPGTWALLVAGIGLGWLRLRSRKP